MKIEDLIIASCDDHIIEPKNTFDEYFAPGERHLAPQYVTDDKGQAFWWWESENKKSFAIGLNAVVGRPREEYGTEPMNIEQMRKGTWDAAAHIDDMNVCGMLTSVCFPTFPGFEGGWFFSAKDKQNAIRVISAYNDWHFDQWCGPFKGRYIETGMLPLFDMDATLKELHRLIKKGCKSVTFPSNPSINLGLPPIHDAYWEPLWALCNEAGVVLNCHIGTGQAPAYASEQSPISAWIAALPMAIGPDAADLLHLDALLRYPNLKFSLSEGGIGWIPYFLERADFTHRHHGPWVRKSWGEDKLPSDIFREHFLTCFIDDRFGCQNYEAVGENIISYELDYPHSDCTWPDVPEQLWTNIHDLPERIINKITHENVFNFFNVDPISILGRENCTVGALREKARNVDTSLISLGGADASVMGDPNKPVTAHDVMQTLFNMHDQQGGAA